MMGYFEPDENYSEPLEQQQEQPQEQEQRIITGTYHIDVVKEIRRELWERFRGYSRRIVVDEATGELRIKWEQTREPILTEKGAEEVFNIIMLFGGENFIFARLSPRNIDLLGKTCAMQIARKLYEERELLFTDKARKPINLEIVAQGCGAIVLAVLSRAIGGREIELWYGSKPLEFDKDLEVM